MPLIKSGSKAAIGKNIEEMEASGHPHDQSMAAALDTARRYGHAAGGRPGLVYGGPPGAMPQRVPPGNVPPANTPIAGMAGVPSTPFYPATPSGVAPMPGTGAASFPSAGGPTSPPSASIGLQSGLPGQQAGSAAGTAGVPGPGGIPGLPGQDQPQIAGSPVMATGVQGMKPPGMAAHGGRIGGDHHEQQARGIADAIMAIAERYFRGKDGTKERPRREEGGKPTPEPKLSGRPTMTPGTAQDVRNQLHGLDLLRETMLNKLFGTKSSAEASEAPQPQGHYGEGGSASIADSAHDRRDREGHAEGLRVPLSGVTGDDGEPVYPKNTPDEPDTMPSWYRKLQPYPVNPKAALEGTLGSGAAGEAIGAAGNLATKALSSPTAKAIGKYATPPLAGAAAMAPAAAGEDKNAPPPGSYIQPSLLEQIFGKADAQQPMSRDEYKNLHRKLQPMTPAEFMQREIENTRNSRAYLEESRAGQTRMMNAAQANAGKMYAGHQQGVAVEDAALDKAYDTYAGDFRNAQKEFLDKSFAERNPNAAAAMTWGAPIASALFAGPLLRKINKTGQGIADEGLAAARSGDMRQLAESLAKAQHYKWAGPLARGAVAAEALAIPGELRLGPEFADKTLLPKTSRAQQEAAKNLGDPFWWGLQVAENAGSGAAGLGAGYGYSKFRGPSPGADLSALRAYGRGMDFTKSPDEMVPELSDRMIAAREAMKRLSGPTEEPPTALRGETIPEGGGPKSGPGGATLGPLGTTPTPESEGPSGGGRRLLGNIEAGRGTVRPEAQVPQPGGEAEPPPNPAPVPEPPAPSGPQLPPGIKLDSLGRPYDAHTGQKVFKRLTEEPGKASRPVNKKSSGKSSASSKENNPGTSEDDGDILGYDDKGQPVPKKPDKPPGGDFGHARGGLAGIPSHALHMASQYARGGKVIVGPVMGNTGGRADKLPVSVPKNAFVIPADVVSHLGEGNTGAGMQKLEKQFGGSYRKTGEGVPILISDGEYVVSPEAVLKHGHGDIDAGHRWFENFVLHNRHQHIQTLANLPGPAR